MLKNIVRKSTKNVWLSNTWKVKLMVDFPSVTMLYYTNSKESMVIFLLGNGHKTVCSLGQCMFLSRLYWSAFHTARGRHAAKRVSVKDHSWVTLKQTSHLPWVLDLSTSHKLGCGHSYWVNSTLKMKSEWLGGKNLRQTLGSDTAPRVNCECRREMFAWSGSLSFGVFVTVA